MKKLCLAVLALALAVGTVIAAEVGPSQGTWTVRERYNYTNITTATTTYVKAAPVALAGILVNGGTMGSITVVDNTATASGATVATISNPVAGQVIPFGIGMTKGICIVTGAATNLTIIWY